MRTVQEHLAACLAAVGPQDPLDVVLADAVGCVLAEDVLATRDLPLTDVAALDGYALRSAEPGTPLVWNGQVTSVDGAADGLTD